MQHVRHAVRALANTPGFTAVAVLTLALGISTTAAMFSVSDALLLRALPYPDSNRLVALRSRHSSPTPDSGLTSPADLADWRARATSFDGIAGYVWRTIDLTGGASSERLRGLSVTEDFFHVFGVTRILGRTFKSGDQGARPIVLGRSVWARRFNADRTLAGSVLDVNVINLSRPGATPHLVLGVAAVDVSFPPLTADFNRGAVTSVTQSGVDDHVDFFLPVFLGEDLKRDDRTLDVVAKLRNGVTVERAQAEMDVIARTLAETFPGTNRNWGVDVVPLRGQILGSTRRVVLWLFIASILVLTVACANVSTLLLARGVARQREVATRAALGATRRRIIAHFVIESLLIAFAASAVGVLLVSAGIPMLNPWLPVDVPLIHRVSINGDVLAFAAVIALAATCLTGIIPAWISTADASITPVGTRGQSMGRRHHRAIAGLVSVQVAVTLMLLACTGLLVRSALGLRKIVPGFESSNLLTMAISLPNNKFDWNHNVVFSRDVVHAVKTDAAVADAAVVQGVPMRPGGFWGMFVPEGMPPPDDGNLPVAHLRVISPDYFRVMHIPLLEGRAFDERDGVGERGHPRFVIVGRMLAARYWPGQQAVGKRLKAGGPDEWLTVAGVVGDVRYAGLDTPPGFEIYLPEALFPQSTITLLVRTTTNPTVVVTDIRKLIAEIDREAFVTDVRTMDQLIGDSLASRSFATMLLTVCAVIALVLALSGIYGMVAQAVTERRFEIGVRLALGSTPVRTVQLMMGRIAVPVAAGAVVGLLGSIIGARVVSAMLFGVDALDAATFCLATGLFVGVALIAAFVPARRATQIDPAVALRCN